MSNSLQPPNHRILVIDDNPSIHDDFRKILRARSHPDFDALEAALFDENKTGATPVQFDVASAYDGKEGLDAVSGATNAGIPFALAFVDIRMPSGWDGIETIAHLWQVDPELQIVICTAYSDYSWDEMATRLGHPERILILKKPFDVIEVLQLAHTLTEKWRLGRISKATLKALEESVEQRTLQLRASNRELTTLAAERQRAARRLERANRLYSVLSGINELIVRARSVDSLCQEACRVLVQEGHFVMAWFGALDPETLLVRPTVWFGHEEGYLSDVTLSANPDSELSSGPGSRALIQGRVALCNDIAHDPGIDVWREKALKRGYASVAAFPLRTDARTLGILALYSGEANFFKEHDLTLLERLSADLSFAIQSIEQTVQLRLQGAALSAAENTIVITDLNGVIRWLNPAFTQLTGYSAAEALGRKMNLLKSGKHPVEFYEQLWQTISSGNSWHGEMVNRSKDGHLLTCEASITPIVDPQGAITHYVAIQHDVSARKRAEEILLQTQEQLRQSQRLEAIGQLAGGVAHDFNNLLAVIRGNADLVIMFGDQLKPEARECLHQVAAAADRAANLTNQLLIFGRKQIMQSRPIDLNGLVSNLTKMLKRIIGEHINLQCDYSARSPYVQADPGMLEQVLVNLVVNARDAMPRGGRLIVRTSISRVDSSHVRTHHDARPGSFVTLSVQDFGTGIPQEILPRIFEPFFTTKDVGKGTGLGLSTVYGIARQHEGWIEVSTELGVGSTFALFLPELKEVPAQTQAAQTGPAPARGSERILLVEDEAEVRAVSRAVLEKFGYRIREAASGGQALQQYSSCARDFDLLLTDMVMPGGITGRELAERLRAHNSALRVLFTSGYSGDSLGQDTAFLRRTRTRFIPKPCSPNQLLNAVRQCLDDPLFDLERIGNKVTQPIH